MPRHYKEARLMNKIKLTEMTERLGVFRPTLSSWESGRKAAPLETLIRMADIYGVTLPTPENSISLHHFLLSQHVPVPHRSPDWISFAKGTQGMVTCKTAICRK